MILTQSLGKEIEEYITHLLGKESVIIDNNGVCLSSPRREQIGTKLRLPKEAFVLSGSKNFLIDNEAKLLIPLDYQNSKVAILILNEEIAKIKEYVPLIKSFAELLIQQYYENNKPVLDSTDQFVIKLLNNANSSDYAFYESEAKVLGYDLSIERMAIVIHLDGFWEKCLLSLDQPSFERDEVIQNAKKNIELSINSFFSRNNDVLIAYLGNDKFVVFKSTKDLDSNLIRKFLKKSFKAIFDPLKNFRIRNIVVGYGNPHTGVSGLVSAFKEADLSLEFGRKLWGTDKSFYFGDLGLLSVLGDGDREKNIEFANQMLSRMKSDELIKTLECFFDQNLNLTDTADKMGVHRNTIIYRLNQISRILNADPRIFEQAMSIKIALLIQKLFN